MNTEIEGTHEYKGRKYKVQREVKFKHPVTREWVVGVEYTPWDEPTEHYIREKNEFLAKFRRWYPE